MNDLAVAARQRQTLENLVIALNQPQPRHNLAHAEHARIAQRGSDLIVRKCRRIAQQRILRRRHRCQGIDAHRMGSDFVEKKSHAAHAEHGCQLVARSDHRRRAVR